MRFSSELVKSSFERLRQSIVEGKTGIERTSALMYFLAYDSAFRTQSPISLDFETQSGVTNREKLITEYCRLVTVRVVGQDNIWSVYNLGVVTRNGTDPAKRISSNFLTVPLKKASQRESPVGYPSRPCPLLLLGNSLGVGSWGVGVHPDWIKNMPMFLTERVSKWPFTDLTIFILRDVELPQTGQFREIIESCLLKRFTKALSSFLMKQIARESKFNPFKLPSPWLSRDYHRAFEDKEWLDSISADDETDELNERVIQLEERVAYLEGVLKNHKIRFMTK